MVEIQRSERLGLEKRCGTSSVNVYQVMEGLLSCSDGFIRKGWLWQLNYLDGFLSLYELFHCRYHCFVPSQGVPNADVRYLRRQRVHVLLYPVFGRQHDLTLKRTFRDTTTHSF